MDDITRGLRTLDPADVNPRFNWGRHLPALGTMGVDFEERVYFRRLRRYRIGRARQALESSELGALLTFDVNNIRYLTSTKIGGWERDKLSRWVLLAQGGEPILWDFGSAAVHHNCTVLGSNGQYARRPYRFARDSTRFRTDGASRQGNLRSFEGSRCRRPVGVDVIEPPMMFHLQKLGSRSSTASRPCWKRGRSRTSTNLATERAAAMVDGAYPPHQ